MTKLDELKKAATEDILGVKSVNTNLFAELLIKECIDIAYIKGDDVGYLQEHFGITDGH